MPPKPQAIKHRAALSLFHSYAMNIFKTKLDWLALHLKVGSGID